MKKIFYLLSFIAILFSCNQTTDTKEIVFICPHGAARSPIAAAYFNKMAKEKNMNYHATFRGTEPDETLSARTIKGLTDDGINIDGWKPQLVSDKDIKNAYKIVTFDCTVPSENSSALLEQWNGTPSPSKEFDSYRQIVMDKVKQLVEELPKN